MSVFSYNVRPTGGGSCIPPTNNYPPDIDERNGAGIVGVELQMDDYQEWDGTDLVFTYQWRADGVNIVDATDMTYTPTSGDVGKYIDVVETATNGCGMGSVPSDNQIGPVTPANMYWVGGTGTWTSFDDTHWSFTSGGVGGAGIPTAYNNVIFDSNSGGGVVTMNLSIYQDTCTNFTSTTFTGTFDNSGAVEVLGNLIMGAAQGSPSIALGSTSGTYSINVGTSTPVLNVGYGFGGATNSSATWIFTGDFTGGTHLLPTTVNLYSGIINTNGHNGNLSIIDLSTGSSTRGIVLGSSSIAASYYHFASGTSVNAGTSLIFLNAFGTLGAFEGGNNTFYNLNILGDPSAQTNLVDSNTFNNIDIQHFTRLNISAGTTTTVVGNITCNGTLGSLNQINFATGAATISCANGAAWTYTYLHNITGTGGGAFTATNSTDGGGNVNWTITP